MSRDRKVSGQKAQAAIEAAIKEKEEEILQYCYKHKDVMLPYLRLLKEKDDLGVQNHLVMMGIVDQILKL